MRVVDEETPVSEADMIGHYKRSKWMAEQVAIEAASAGQEDRDSESYDADWARWMRSRRRRGGSWWTF